MGNKLPVKEQFYASHSSADSDSAELLLSEKVSLPGSSEHGPNLTPDPDNLRFTRSISEDLGQIIDSTSTTECQPMRNQEKPTTRLLDDKRSSRALAAREAECMNSNNYSGEVVKGASPFRLLQAYASDDSTENDEEPDLKDGGLKTVLPLVTVGATNVHKDTGFDRETKARSNVECPFKTGKDFGQHSGSSGLNNVQVDKKHESLTSISCTASSKPFLEKNASRDAFVNDVFSGNQQDADKIARFSLNVQKIDRFGRLVPERASESDSDDSCYAGRRSKRGRNHSHSRSPLDRRKRGSPRRRRHWRSRSQRSRSRSPQKSNKGKMAECFDFLRGRCYHGASCSYVHHYSGKNDGSRRHRSKQQNLQPPSGSRTYNAHEETKKISFKNSGYEHDVIGKEMKLNQDIHAGSIDAIKNGNTICKNTKSGSVIYKDVAVDYSDIIKSDNSREVTDKAPETNIVQEEPKDCTTIVVENSHKAMKSNYSLPLVPSKPVCDSDRVKSYGEGSLDMLSSFKYSAIQQSDSDLSDEVLGDADHPPQQTGESFIPDSSPEDVNVPQPQGDSNLKPQATTSQPQSAHSEGFPPYMLPNHNSLFCIPPNSPRASSPPLPPHDHSGNRGTAPPGIPLQFQQSHVPPRNEFGSQLLFRPYPTELPSHSQVGDSQHRDCLLVQEPCHPPLPECNPSTQQFGGPNLLREDQLGHLPIQGLNAANPFTQSKNYPHPMPLLQASPATKMHSFPGDKLPSGEILKSSSHINPYLQQQQLPLGLNHSVTNDIYSTAGKINTSPRYPLDILDRNQLSCLPDLVLSRSSTHYNPYASTFEQPLSSRFNSDLMRQRKDAFCASKHDFPVISSNPSVDGQGASARSRCATSSPKPAGGVGPIIPVPGSDQYDPLVDSIESSSKSFKFDHIQKWEAANASDIMLRFNGSNKPLDVEENNNKKEDVGISLVTPLDDEEFVETADAGVDDVENGSESKPDAIDPVNPREMEIDQITSPGRSKKSKESRSMKLFKVALADFVKEVLKPSWRHGNMSKEAFKTVVKKTVDKVSGAMKSHKIPKSKAKINQYIYSSQRKLTKLVMGYVDKYAKG